MMTHYLNFTQKFRCQTYVNSTTHQVLPPGELKSEFNVGQIELEKDMV